MNFIEVNDLLNFISFNYKNFEVNDEMVYAWLNVLQEYDGAEVKKALEDAMSEEKFQYEPPKVYYIIRNLIKKYDKVDFSKQVIYCKICNRPLNQSEFNKHYDRCLSVDYVIREVKRWSNKTLSKRQLFDMSDKEFNQKYLELLKYIYEKTKNREEKKRISFVLFKTPSEEEAKRFLSKGR